MSLFGLLLVGLFFGNVSPIDGKEKRVVQLDNLESCKPGLPMEFVNISFAKDATRRTLVNTTFRIGRDFGANVEKVVKIVRCSNKESPDTCQNFTTLKMTNLCQVYAAKSQLWSPFFGSMVPKIECPLKKNDHVLINGWLDGDRTPFPIGRNTYWKVHWVNYEMPTRKEVMCVQFEGRLVPVRN